MMTALENKLIELFRACPDDKKFAVLETAQLLCDLSSPDPSASAPDPDSVQTSTPDSAMICAGQAMEKTSHKADVPLRYQMTLPELCFLHNLLRDGDEFNALRMAFDYGFVKGNRATRRGKVKAL